MTPKATVEAFWAAMQTNDFAQAALCLSEDFVGDWPQSNERIIGRENFTQINSHYPTTGTWRFTILSLIAEANKVVTEVAVTDGELHDRAITFHTVTDGLISHQREF